MKGQSTLHGVFLNIFNVGIHLLGESGIGKSELALALIDRKHQLIADDAPVFVKESGKIIGFAPEQFKNFMLVRGIGIVNIAKLYGSRAVKKSKELNLFIELKKIAPLEEHNEEQTLRGVHHSKTLLGEKLPLVTLFFNTHSSLPLLVEVVVKNYRLKSKSRYDAFLEFEKIQSQQIGNTHS